MSVGIPTIIFLVGIAKSGCETWNGNVLSMWNAGVMYVFM